MLAKRIDAPQKAVFVVYIKFNEDFTEGTLLSWEWVVSDDQISPNGENERYDKEVWRNEKV